MALIRQRKLTNQQLRRVTKQQAHSQADDDMLLEGVVMAHYGKQLEVQITTLPKKIIPQPEFAKDDPEPFWQPIVLGDIWRCHTRTNLPMLSAGDKVRWIADSNTGFGCIEILNERSSLISRPDRYHKLKPVAANTDILAIVFSPLPLPAATLIDRYLVVAHHANVTPLLILNKADMLDDEQHQHALTLLNNYKNLGYDTLTTSVTSALDSDVSNSEATTDSSKLIAKGLSQLKEKISNKLVVFAGQSGVGKSSIINAFLPKSAQIVNVISENSQLGQHTTTTSRLLPFITDDFTLEHGGIVDTPGIREYGIWHLTPSDILAGFTELQEFIGYCKFRDCKHTHNAKGCAMRQAVEDGKVQLRRMDSLINLQIEADTKDYK